MSSENLRNTVWAKSGILFISNLLFSSVDILLKINNKLASKLVSFSVECPEVLFGEKQYTSSHHEPCKTKGPYGQY